MTSTAVISLCILLLFFGLLIGLAIGDIGTKSKCPSRVYGVELPITLALLILLPAVLGFLIGIGSDIS